MEYGERRTCSVRKPPSSEPIRPGREPMRPAAELASLYSPISIRIRADSSSKQRLGQRFGQLGLSDAGRADEQKRRRRALELQVGAHAARGLGYGMDRFRLAENALAQRGPRDAAGAPAQIPACARQERRIARRRPRRRAPAAPCRPRSRSTRRALQQAPFRALHAGSADG